MFTENADEEQLTKITNVFGPWHAAIEKHLAQRKTPYIAGNRITIADFLFFSAYYALVWRKDPVRISNTERAKACCAGAVHVPQWYAKMEAELVTWFPKSPNSPA